MDWNELTFARQPKYRSICVIFLALLQELERLVNSNLEKLSIL